MIAATVIGGTSLAGGVGTIYGAILGALVMQSLQSGMTLLGFDCGREEMWSARCWSSRSGSTTSTAAEPPRVEPWTPTPETPLVELHEISIAFGGVKAVDHAYIDLYPGEVVGLLGHNGAGKSA